MKRILAVLLLVLAVPLSAQDLPKAGGGAFRTGFGAMLLAPYQNGTILLPHVSRLTDIQQLQQRPPSLRVTFEHSIEPGVGIHLGAMHLAPKNVGLWEGVGGVRINLLRGRLRLSAFGEGSFGRFQALRDLGGYWYVDGSGVEQYQPRGQDTVGLAWGAGGGGSLQLILGPGLTLDVTGGYWYHQALDDALGASPVDPVGGRTLNAMLQGPYVGAGIRFTGRDEVWYWRTSGRDDAAPQFVVTSPDAVDGKTVDAGVLEARLQFVVADLSGVRSMRVGGNPVWLSKAPANLQKQAGLHGPAMFGETVLMLNAGPNQIVVSIEDGAGNVLNEELTVLGPPIDETGPRIIVMSPQENSELSTDRVTIVGAVADRSNVASVAVNGIPATLTAPTDADKAALQATERDQVRHFQVDVPLVNGENTLNILAADTAGNRGMIAFRVMRPGGGAIAQRPGTSGGPIIDITEPREWAGGGTRGIAATPKSSVMVKGRIRHPTGIQDVLINGARAAVELDASGTTGSFVGYAAVEPSSRQVEITARGLDGTMTSRVFSVVPTPAMAAQGRTGQPTDPGGLGGFRGERWAVVIGVSDYRDPGIPDLAYADDDARSIYNFLVSQDAGLGGFKKENVQLLINQEATARNIRSALFTFLKNSTEDDVIFIYIAGHGMPDPERLSDLYILAHDTELHDLAATGVPMSDVNEAIGKAYAMNKVLFTDACHSAGVGAGGTRAVNVNQINSAFLDAINSSTGGFVAFTASEANQLSNEGEQWGGGHGVFTYYLLEGLKGGADMDQDRIVTLGEVMEFTRDKVRRETRNSQIPTISLTTFDRYWPMAIVTRD